MFIVWGEYNTEKERGFVGDKCANCGRVTVLRVTQHYRVSHLYYIPLGSGTLVASLLTCSECDGKAHAEIDKYTVLLPKKATRNMSVGQILEHTNPSLTEALAYRADLEERARAAETSPGGGPDARVELAFARLAELNAAHPEVMRLHASLSQWSVLEPADRAKVFRDVDAVVADAEQQEAASRFVGLMSQRFPLDVDGFFGVATFVVVAVLGLGPVILIATKTNLLDEIGVTIAVIMAFAAAAIATVLVVRRLRRRSQRNFFRTTFLPEAHYQGVNVLRALAVVQEINPTDPSLDANLRGLVQAVPLLREVLEEAHPDGDLATAVANLAATYPESAPRRAPASIGWVGPVVVAVVIASGAGLVAWVASTANEKRQAEAEQRNALAAPFLPHLAEYMAEPAGKDLQPPYRRGKLIPVNLGGKGVDGIFLALPVGVRAEQPQDVGTVAWLVWGAEKVGQYGDRVDAVVITCKVTLIDKSKNTIIAEKDFRGGPPPQSRKPQDPNHGSYPNGEVVAWLAGLPVR